MGLFALGWHVARREQRSLALTGQKLPFMTWEVALSILLFAAVAGARYHTGYDHAMYLHQYVSYEKYGFFTRDFEPLFMWVTQLMASAHIHYFFYFALWAAIEIAVLYYALNDYKQLIPWVASFLVLSPIFLHLMNTMRQGVVECALPLLLLLLRDKKYLKFAVLVVLLAMMHSTAVLLFGLCLLRIDATSQTMFRNWSVALFLIAVVVGAMPFWLDWFSRLAQKLFSGSMIHYGTELSINDHHFAASFGPVRLLTLSCQLMVLWLSNQTLNFFKDNRLMRLLALAAAIYVIGTALMCNTTNFYQRPLELFIVCFVVLTAATTYFLLITGKKILAAILIALCVSPLVVTLVKANFYPNASNLPTLYHFFFCS